MTKKLEDRIMALFEGYAEAYGTYDSGVPNEAKGGKLEIRATARTIRAQVTAELWRQHLAGRQPLGIIPIRDNNTCLWGAIDVDEYDVDHAALVELCAKHQLPLVVCRTKSGGAHLYLFMAEPVQAAVMQAKLREVAALIGHGASEVFPKQRTVALERGDLGSWLNMPYFGRDETDRYAVGERGRVLTADEFVRRAEGLQQPAKFMEQSHRKKPEKDPDFGDGPPCMQHLAAVGVETGHRNEGLFALATFAKKKYGGRWQEVVEDWNRKYVNPPLPAQEVLDVVRQVERKDYNYKCKTPPISLHCNSGLCRTRRFGVGGENDFPLISGLSVMGKEPPLWFLDVNGERMELTTDELQNYKAFHKRCMEELRICFRMMKSETWLELVSSAMRELVIMDAPEEVGRTGHFKELLGDFLTDRHSSDDLEHLLLGRPVHDRDSARRYFRLKDLQLHLERGGFKTYTRGQIVARIQQMGGDKHFFNFKGKGVNCWWVPEDAVGPPTPQTKLPRLEREPV